MPKKYDAITKTRLMNMVDTFHVDGEAALLRRFSAEDKAKAMMAFRHLSIVLARRDALPTLTPREKVTSIQRREALLDIENSALGQQCKRLGIVEFGHDDA